MLHAFLHYFISHLKERMASGVKETWKSLHSSSKLNSDLKLVHPYGAIAQKTKPQRQVMPILVPLQNT